MASQYSLVSIFGDKINWCKIIAGAAMDELLIPTPGKNGSQKLQLSIEGKRKKPFLADRVPTHTISYDSGEKEVRCICVSPRWIEENIKKATRSHFENVLEGLDKISGAVKTQKKKNTKKKNTKKKNTKKKTKKSKKK